MKENKLIVIFNPKEISGNNPEEKICESARKISNGIEEYLNTSSFLIAMDSIQSGSNVFLIKDDKIDKNQKEVDFVKV